MSEENSVPMIQESSNVSGHRLVHLDLKGAPPKLIYYEWLFPMLHKWGATGLLVEYEDMFPYSAELSDLAAPHAYKADEIQRLLSLAKENELIVIPLIQTFGHFEFVLKHDKFRCLRELDQSPMALCPSNEESLRVVTVMIDQILALHPSTTHLHIGADEVFHLGLCPRCLARIENDKATRLDIFLSHIKPILEYVSEKYSNVQAIMWDDMLRNVDISVVKKSGIGKLVELMVWYYQPKFDGLPDVWPGYAEVFDSVWLASAYKGATGPCMIATDINYHVENHKMWLAVAEQRVRPAFKNLRGFVLTGWQRYDHYATLCELLPVGLPSLAICLLTVTAGAFTKDIHAVASKDLCFSELIPMFPVVGLNCDLNMVCDFYGCAIYRSVLDLIMLKADYKQLKRSDRVKGWMTPWQVSHNYTNPVHLNHFLPELRHLQQSFGQLAGVLRKALDEVFYPITVDEWMSDNVQCILDKINTLMSRAEAQAILGGRPITWDSPQQTTTPL